MPSSTSAALEKHVFFNSVNSLVMPVKFLSTSATSLVYRQQAYIEIHSKMYNKQTNEY